MFCFESIKWLTANSGGHTIQHLFRLFYFILRVNSRISTRLWCGCKGGTQPGLCLTFHQACLKFWKCNMTHNYNQVCGVSPELNMNDLVPACHLYLLFIAVRCIGNTKCNYVTSMMIYIWPRFFGYCIATWKCLFLYYAGVYLHWICCTRVVWVTLSIHLTIVDASRYASSFIM